MFTPCTLTILGVIMFLRLGYRVGQAGVRHAIAVVLISKAITALTALSFSAIATNTRPKGGGAYYLISRSLGVDFGSAIGIVFFLAQAVSVAEVVVAENVPEAIGETSKDAAITFIGFSPMTGAGRPFTETMEMLSQGLHTVVFVHSAGGMELDV